MDCNEIRDLLGAQVDGELDLAHSRELEKHLAACPACATAAQEITAQRNQVRSTLPRYAAPDSLRTRVRAEIRSAAGERARTAWWPSWQIASTFVCLVAVFVIGYVGGVAHSQGARFADEVLSSHLRSLEASHLTDVVSTDQHTVKPWFAGRVDFSPHVVDLAAQGFPLIGGRLDRLDGRQAAALVYQRHKHIINLFVQPVSGHGPSEMVRTLEGYHLRTWTDGDLRYTAVSDLEEAELAIFAGLIRQAAS